MSLLCTSSVISAIILLWMWCYWPYLTNFTNVFRLFSVSSLVSSKSPSPYSAISFNLHSVFNVHAYYVIISTAYDILDTYHLSHGTFKYDSIPLLIALNILSFIAFTI